MSTGWKNGNKIHYVYVLKLCDEVVYVGCTLDVKRRLRQHTADKVFDNVEVFKHFRKWKAMMHERELVRKFVPKYNFFPANSFQIVSKTKTP